MLTQQNQYDTIMIAARNGSSIMNEARALSRESVDETQTTTPTCHQRRKKRKSSWVWKHFERRGSNIGCCEFEFSKHRNPAILSPTTAAGNLSNHLKVKHEIGKGKI